MGISGLLVGLKSTACVSGHIRDFAGQAVAVDASSWLHKSVYSIADHYVECVENHNTVDQRCIQAASNYIIKRCQELSCAGIVRVYLVMDGQRCPLKAQTNQDRERRRLQNLQQAREYKQLGKYDKMYEKYRSCIKVHSALGREVVKEVQQKLKSTRVQVQIVWAPYEADAQLIQLCVEGLTQAVITEDSDVLVYSATTCTPVPIIFKLDGQSGKCDIISMSWLFDSKNALLKIEEQKKKKASGLEAFLQTFAIREERNAGLGVRLFVQACVFAGCDYAPNELGGIGTVTSFKHVRNNIHRNADERFRSILQQCGKQGTAEYEELLSKSETVFYYHPVLDVGRGHVKYLNDPHNVTDHRPSLERFGSDWTEFLGDVTLPADSSTTQPRLGGELNTRTTVLPAASFFAKRKAGAISNPYVMSEKRLRSADPGRKKLPLNELSPNSRKMQKASPNKSNRFSGFSLKKSDDECSEMESKRKKDDLLGIFYGDKEDVRGVKRIFPKDGSRVTLKQKPANLPSSLLSGSPVNDAEIIIVDEDDGNISNIQNEDPVIPVETGTEHVMSRFFSKGKRKGISRRVTYEPEAKNSSIVDNCVLSGRDSPQNKLYDDFMSPAKDPFDAQPLDEDAIIESSPAFDAPNGVRTSFQKPFITQPQTLCFRLGDPLPLAARPKAIPVRSGRNALRPSGDKQTTLYKHFHVKSKK